MLFVTTPDVIQDVINVNRGSNSAGILNTHITYYLYPYYPILLYEHSYNSQVLKS